MSALVRNRDRANGVHQSLQALLEAWIADGSHDVLIAPNGGLRTDPALQKTLAANGNSNATSLEQTPHGRGAAIDVWPVSFLPFVPKHSGGIGLRWYGWDELPAKVRAEFAAFGVFAEARGFRWGGRFTGTKFPNGDQPHVEITTWRSMPFPPEAA